MECKDSCFPNEKLTLGFIGAGNMAKAIGFSILSQGLMKPNQIIVSAPSRRNLVEWEEKQVATTNNNSLVLENSSIVFLCVKPQYFEDAVASLKNSSKLADANILNTCLVSVMVGVKISTIKQQFMKFFPHLSASSLNVLRVMPNTPLMVGKGCSVLCGESSDWMGPVQELMSAGGTCEIIDESLMDAVSAISGSGPAYMYMTIEALADGGVRCGLPRALAMRLAAQTMSGAAEMVLKGQGHPGLLKDQVCSPGGTTIAAVHALEKSSLRAAYMNAIEAAVKRAKELAGNS